MLSVIWENVTSQKNSALFRSFFFFLLIAQTTQFTGCVVFSLIDLAKGRVPFKTMVFPALSGALSFVPFIAMWYLDLPVIEIRLPIMAPTWGQVVTQLVLYGCMGDFLHYWMHRLLHSNKILKHKVHVVHHTYDGPLYSWIGMQVHPVEVFMITLAIYTPLVLFAHPLVLWTFAFWATLNATCAHSGYVGGFAAMRFPFALSSDDRQLHHDVNATKNFGNMFRVWDMAFETYAENKKYPAISLWG